MPKNDNERFRAILTMNLLNVVQKEQIEDVLKAVDITLSNFDLIRKKMELITISDVPEVVKIYLASKAISNTKINTLTQYKYKLINFFSEIKKPFTDITTNDIRIYLHAYKVEHNASDNYMENIRCTLNRFFQWLVDNEYLMKNPCKTINTIKYSAKPREPFTAYELEMMRWNCKTEREKALVDFLFSTGVRVSECSALNKSDINWYERSVRVLHGKGDKSRITYFNAESEFSLRLYLSTRNDDNEALFVQHRNPHNRLSARGIENEIKNLGERCDIKAFPHKLRHTFGTAGINGGMPLEKLQMLMGHESPRTTLIYAKIDNSSLKMEHKRVYA